MILQMNGIRKNDNTTVEAFRDYMLNVHAHKAAAPPELAGYHQGHILATQDFILPSTSQAVGCSCSLHRQEYNNCCADESSYTEHRIS